MGYKAYSMIWAIGILIALYAVLKLRRFSREPTPGFDLVQDAFLNPKTKEVWTVEGLKAFIRAESGRKSYPYPNIAVAIAQQESGFRPDAVNPEVSDTRGDQPDSVGLMGLQFRTALAFVPFITSEDDLKDPRVNIIAGVGYLSYLHNKWFLKYGNDGVIQMYNLGESRYLKGSRNTNYLFSVKRNAGLA